MLQSPQVRAADNAKASLKIGDKVPTASGSFQPGIGDVVADASDDGLAVGARPGAVKGIGEFPAAGDDAENVGPAGDRRLQGAGDLD